MQKKIDRRKRDTKSTINYGAFKNRIYSAVSYIIPKSTIEKILDYITRIYFKVYRLRHSIIARKNSSDMQVFMQIFVLKEYYLNFNIKPQFIVDAGANVGYSSLYFHKKYPAATIIAIEPETQNFNVLVKNTKNISNIKCMKRGLWSCKTKLNIFNKNSGEWSYRTKQSKPGERHDVDTITVKELLDISKNRIIDILKIDIEGAEKEIFSKNCEWLSRVNVIIIELHDNIYKDCSKIFYQRIKKYDFKKYKNGENIILRRKKFI